MDRKNDDVRSPVPHGGRRARRDDWWERTHSRTVRPTDAPRADGRENPKKTSWKGASDWYDSIVGEKGHYYHQHVILPNVLRLLELQSGDSLLDIGCGQGVLSRQLPHGIDYVGIDVAEPLLAAARRYPSREMRTFIHGDVTHPWPLSKHTPFSHAACILALQNIEQPEVVFEELAKAAAQSARAIFVLNHPYFRIPRQSRWGFDEASKTQTREIFSYMSAQKIPIVTHPGKGGAQTWSFHRPLSDYVAMGRRHGFVIEMIEEWCSPKESTGSAARYENRARGEFPLFMALLFRKEAIPSSANSRCLSPRSKGLSTGLGNEERVLPLG